MTPRELAKLNAFPDDEGTTGLTVRQYYASKAMPAIILDARIASGPFMNNMTPERVAEEAFKYADAMINYQIENHFKEKES